MRDESVDGAEVAFLARVEQQGGLTSRAEAREVTEATLRVLATAVSGGQMAQITRHLPEPLQPYDSGSGNAASFDKKAFLDAISGAVPSTDLEEVELLACAVLNTVREHLPEEQVSDTLEQLPNDLGALFYRTPGVRGN